MLDGDDVRSLPPAGRKRLLKSIMRARRSRLRYVEHLAGNGIGLFELVCAHDLEGVIAKWKRGTCRIGADTSWLKTKKLLAGRRQP